MNNNTETWLPVVGYESTHLVSNMGSVKSLPRTWICGKYKSVRFKGEVILTPIVHTQGYLRINMHFNGIRKFIPIHRMVAEAYIPNPMNKREVNHKYGNKKDNRVSQLEWVTKSENNKHAYEFGLNGAHKRKAKKYFITN